MTSAYDSNLKCPDLTEIGKLQSTIIYYLGKYSMMRQGPQPTEGETLQLKCCHVDYSFMLSNLSYGVLATSRGLLYTMPRF